MRDPVPVPALDQGYEINSLFPLSTVQQPFSRVEKIQSEKTCDKSLKRKKPIADIPKVSKR
jgi:hypothetical protein